MDAVTSDALAGLRSAMAQLVPDASSNNVTRRAIATPGKISPVGVGGVVALRRDPEGMALGRRIEASVRVTFRGGDEAGREAFALETSSNVLSRASGELRAMGILRLRPDVEVESDASQRVVRFGVVYEFVAEPAAGEGVIERVPTRVEVESA